TAAVAQIAVTQKRPADLLCVSEMLLPRLQCHGTVQGIAMLSAVSQRPVLCLYAGQLHSVQVSVLVQARSPRAVHATHDAYCTALVLVLLSLALASDE